MERGSITICCQNISSYIEEKIRRRKLLFQKNSDFEKSSGKKGGGYQDFPSKNFSLIMPKHFVGEPFCVSENFWYRGKLRKEDVAGITIFRQMSFVSQYRIVS